MRISDWSSDVCSSDLKCYSYLKERNGFSRMPQTEKRSYDPEAPVDPRVETLVNELIGRVADKWTLLVLEEQEEHGACRFTRLAQLVPGISQTMMTQTLPARERHGLGHPKRSQTRR